MVAASEVYGEVATQDGSTDQFDFTYALTVCTVGFIKQHLEAHHYYASRSLVVVECFNDQIIKEALEALLPNMEALAIPQ
jgi:hypothetical protein